MNLYQILLNYEHIIFDCDGVILDSNKIKTNAFKKLFHENPKCLIDKIVTYHKNNGGKSRYMKIKYFYENLLKKKLSKKHLKNQAKIYGKISLNDLKESNFIPGLIELLIFLKKKNKNLYVVSGSDEIDLIKILKYRLPLESERMKSVYIGDSEYDYSSSKAMRLDFIYISGYSDWKVERSFLKANGISSFKDFGQ